MKKVYGALNEEVNGSGWVSISSDRDWNSSYEESTIHGLPDGDDFLFITKVYSRKRDARRRGEEIAKRMGWKLEWV